MSPLPRTPPTPLWTEFLTHACENIAFQQLLLRAVKSHKIHDARTEGGKIQCNRVVMEPQKDTLRTPDVVKVTINKD